MNNLTVITIDTAYHNLTKQALEKTIEITDCKNIVVLSDKDILPGSKWIKIDTIDIRSYNKIVLKDMINYVDTDYFMIVQYDGMPINKHFWKDEFLNYDYIGAPWYWHPSNQNVGNGGFSLRTRKLAEELAKPEIIFDPPQFRLSTPAEDDHICRFYRPYLETKGIKFPPATLAFQFSAENPAGKFPSYGFHGTLCLPYYLTDDQLEYYINSLLDIQFSDKTQIRILYGLYCAQRYDHMELMMDRGVAIMPHFKKIVLDQFREDHVHFPNIDLEELESVLINY